MTYGKQRTFIWNLDDMTISHSESEEVTNIIGYLKKICGGM